LKGTLYRCRKCKSHFRVRGDSTLALMIGGVTAAAVVGLLIFILINSAWDQISSGVSAFQTSLPSFRKAQPKVQPATSQPDGATGPQAEALAQRVRVLYKQAASLERQIPQLDKVYRDIAASYVRQPQQGGQRSGGAVTKAPDGVAATAAAQIEERLETQHQKVAKVEADFRNDLAPVMTGVAKVAETCSKAQVASASPQSQACDDFTRTISLFRTQVNAALDGLKSAEQEYQKARRTIDESKAKHSAQSISSNPKKE
jgi:hypothetical protein